MVKGQMGISTNIKIESTDKKTRIKKARSIIMMSKMISLKDNKLKNKDSNNIPWMIIGIIVPYQNIDIRRHVV